MDLYQPEHGIETWDLDEVSAWAIREGYDRPEPIDPAKALKAQMTKALKNEHITAGPRGAQVSRCQAHGWREAVDLVGDHLGCRSGTHGYVASAAATVHLFRVQTA